MTATAENVARDQWYCIEPPQTLVIGITETRLPGEDLQMSRTPSDDISVMSNAPTLPTRADASSIAYRRWLTEKGLVYGTTSMVA